MPSSLLQGGGRKAAELRGSTSMTGRFAEPAERFSLKFPDVPVGTRFIRQDFARG